jgi:hypothetical protein
MGILNFNVDDSSFLNQQTILSILKLLPTATLIIDLKGNIEFINDQAFQFFRFTSESDFLKISNSLVVDLKRTIDLKNETNTTKDVIQKKILLRRFDNTIACINIYVRFISSDNEHLLIQFTEVSVKNQALIIELLKNFKSEVNTLKPYLNKPGKELLENILNHHSEEKMKLSVTKRKTDADFLEPDRIAKITELFPSLSTTELILCSFLSLNLTIDEIAGITGKTSNSLRVLFHRIVHKSNFTSGKDLIRELESIESLS